MDHSGVRSPRCRTSSAHLACSALVAARADLVWSVVVPVKRSVEAKSRLTAPAGVDHASLSRALAADTLAAAAALPYVHLFVLTSDEEVRARWEAELAAVGDDHAFHQAEAVVDGERVEVG